MNYCPTIDLVIPCYNSAHIVEKCVSSVLNQDYDNSIKIFLIDDGSTDQTPELLRSFSKKPNVTIIHHEQNMGLASARNTGIKAGNSEIICFLDSDMVVGENWIRSHIEILSHNNVVGVIGDSTIPKKEPENALDKYLYDQRRGARQFGERERINFQYFLFNNTSIRRSVFEIIDLFDEKITTYGGEDTELAIRLWEVYPDSLRFSSKAVSEHHHKRSLDTFCELMFQYGKHNLSSLITQFPQYTNQLGGQWIHSIKGYSLFNPIVRWGAQKTHQFCDHYWLTRYLVVDAVIRGARSFSVNKRG